MLKNSFTLAELGAAYALAISLRASGYRVRLEEPVSGVFAVIVDIANSVFSYQVPVDEDGVPHIPDISEIVGTHGDALYDWTTTAPSLAIRMDDFSQLKGVL